MKTQILTFYKREGEEEKFFSCLKDGINELIVGTGFGVRNNKKNRDILNAYNCGFGMRVSFKFAKKCEDGGFVITHKGGLERITPARDFFKKVMEIGNGAFEVIIM